MRDSVGQSDQSAKKQGRDMTEAWKKGEQRLDKFKDQKAPSARQESINDEYEEDESEPYTQQQTDLGKLASDGEIFQAVPYGQEIAHGEETKRAQQ